MKKLLVLALALVMALCAVGAMAEPITLTYAEVNPLDTIVGKTATFFKEKVEELTGGSVVINIQHSGVLGTEAQVLNDILSGGNTVDLCRFSAFQFTAYGCQKATLLSIPYTFVSREHFWNFANSELAAEFLAEPQEIGLPLRGICYGEEGFRHFFFRDAVTDIKSLKEMKIRVSEDPVMTGMVKNLGANPTVVSFTELYSALQTGVVDAAEQPIANYKSNAFPEVAPYLMLDGHTLGAIQITVTDQAWAKLNAEQQAAILEAGKLTQAFNAELSASEEAKVLEQLKAEGVTVIDVEDKAAWAAACAETISANTASQAELYQKIVDMQ